MEIISLHHDHRPQWKLELSQAIASTEELLRILEIDAQSLNLSQQAAFDFPLRVPLSFVQRMHKGNPEDPLLLQVLPITAEESTPETFSADPLEEASFTPVPGLIHKYKNRVLLIGAQTCAINCRYCFRRHFPYQENRITSQQLNAIINYIETHKELDEVILSGGDPLANNDRTLSKIIDAINQVGHIKRIRIHTRLPIVIPSRINDELLEWVNTSRCPITFVVHSNHANEINSDVTQAIKKLIEQGCLILNQTVLLKGINDQASTLIELSEALFNSRIQPYYLNLLDRVSGSAHFEVSECDALEIYEQMLSSTSGYLVPKLVRESPEVPYKRPHSPKL